MIFLAIQLRRVVEKHREKTRSNLIFETPAIRPGSSRVHIDCANIWHENLEWTAERNIQAFRVPGVVGHVESLEQSFLHARKCGCYQRVRFMNRHGRVVVIERRLQTESTDGRTKAPAKMGEPLNEMRCQPEVVCAELAIV